jgi:tetratricopeptide (TPR) repeat protein/tRNA A-37 threonylcarbamoyl transferase component Bud32
MNNSARTDFDQLPIAERCRIDEICSRFEDGWRRGDTPVMADFLQREPNGTLFRELLYLECEYRRARGEPVDPGMYRSRFECYATVIDEVFASVLPPLRNVTRDGAVASCPVVSGYEVLEEIGRGGMGRVYRARHLGLNRVVALKTIRDETSAPMEHERLRAEAEAAAKLQHPNIVQIFDTGTYVDVSGQPTPYLAMELVAGGSLADRLRRGPLTPVDSAATAEVLAGAVHHAHERGVIHRDLKPANILLARATAADDAGGPIWLPGIRVVDFGLAKCLNARSLQTQSGHFVGTPRYASPEQARGTPDAIGPATDIFALGVILYEMLTGRPPFQAASPLETVFLLLHTEPVAPRRLAPRLSRDLETICLKCLEKTPGRRYGSALQLATDLRAFLDGKPIHARRTTVVVKGLKWVRRQPLVAGLGACAMVCLVMMLLVWFRFTTNLAEQRNQSIALAKAAAESEAEAGRQARLATNSLNDARRVSLHIHRLVRDNNDLKASGLDDLRHELLGQLLDLHQSLAAKDLPIAPLQFDEAEVYHTQAQMALRLGRMAEARDAMTKAVALIEPHYQAQPDSDSLKLRLADLIHDQGVIDWRSGDTRFAEERIRRAIQLAESVVDREPRSYALFVTAHYRHRLGQFLDEVGRGQDADTMLQSAQQAIDETIAQAEQTRSTGRAAPDHYALRADVRTSRGNRALQSNDLNAAESLFRAAVVDCRSPVQDYPLIGYESTMARALACLGRLLAIQKRDPDAVAAWTEARRLLTALVERHAKVPRYRRELVELLRETASFHRSRGQAVRADAVTREAALLDAPLREVTKR